MKKRHPTHPDGRAWQPQRESAQLFAGTVEFPSNHAMAALELKFFAAASQPHQEWQRQEQRRLPGRAAFSFAPQRKDPPRGVSLGRKPGEAYLSLRASMRAIESAYWRDALR